MARRFYCKKHGKSIGHCERRDSMHKLLKHLRGASRDGHGLLKQLEGLGGQATLKQVIDAGGIEVAENILENVRQDANWEQKVGGIEDKLSSSNSKKKEETEQVQNVNTYNNDLFNNYKEAMRLNNKDEKEDFYYCATRDSGITCRRLNLMDNSAFTENLRQDTTPDQAEYQIEAYLVKEAKKNKWILPILDIVRVSKSWELIDAERNFELVKSPKKFDLLAHSGSHQYIILELKKDSRTASLRKAVEELNKYAQLLGREITGANRIYGKNVNINAIKRYVVYPGTDQGRTEDSFIPNDIGIIHFTNGETKEAIMENTRNGTMEFMVIRDNL